MEEEMTNPVENVLNGYYQNAVMGSAAIGNLLDAVADKEFRKELFAQKEYYDEQKQNLTAQLAEMYQLPVKQGTLSKFWTDMMIKMKKLKGIDVHEAAKMMVEGTNMGLIELHQVMNRNTEIPEEFLRQGESIISHEREYLNRITPYL